LDFVSAVQTNCTNLRCIRLLSCSVDAPWMEYLASSQTLERLTFNSTYSSHNLPQIETLKEFNVHNCYHLSESLLKSVLNSISIENLTLEYQRSPISFYINLAPIIEMSNLKSVCLFIYPETIHQLNLLLQLNGLLKLKITSKIKKLDVDEFLIEMAQGGCLEELQIFNFSISTKTFFALSKMKLKLLNIDSPKYEHSQLDVKIICQTLAHNMPNLNKLTLSIHDK
jgi:hypothetical protein